MGWLFGILATIAILGGLINAWSRAIHGAAWARREAERAQELAFMLKAEVKELRAEVASLGRHIEWMEIQYAGAEDLARENGHKPPEN